MSSAWRAGKNMVSVIGGRKWFRITSMKNIIVIVVYYT